MDFQLTNETTTFLEHLHRGGEYANFWMLDEVQKFFSKRTQTREPCKRTFWFPVGQVPTVVRIGDTEHLYFSVYPTMVQGERWQRNTNPTVAAINCLFAEFDAKDYEGGMVECHFHVEHLDPQPSVIINSGGGFHCYWLLDQPFVLNDDNRKGVIDLLKRWVKWVGGDDVNDLARVLRVPGSLNIKAKYAPDYPEVYFVKRDMDCLYDLDELAVHVPQPTPKPVATKRHEWRAYSVDAFDQSQPQRYTDRAMELVHSASHGHGLHYALRDASCMIGRVVGGGFLSEAEAIDMLENAAVQGGAENMAGAKNTIRSGIALGQSNPFVIIEREEIAPIMKSGRAYCPDHSHRPLERGRKSGWYCQARTTDGYCGFRWSGEGYTPPMSPRERLNTMRVRPMAI